MRTGILLPIKLAQKTFALYG